MNRSDILLQPGNSTTSYLTRIFRPPMEYFELGYMQSLIDSIELLGLAFCLQFLIIIMDILIEGKYPQAVYFKWGLIALQFPLLIVLMFKLLSFYTGV